MSAALIIDIILWGSVAAVGFIAWQRGRLVLVSSARRHHGFHQYRAAHRARRDRLGIYRRRHPQEIITGWLGPDSGWLGRPHRRDRGRRDAGRAGGRLFDRRGGVEEPAAARRR